MREFILAIAAFGAVLLSLSGEGQAAPTFEDVFNRHGTIMLLIDPASGEIENANPAAAKFYGYSQDQLRAMKIQEINTLTRDQVAAERKLAAQENRNYFIFRHRLKDGNVRTVEVHSHPFQFDGRALLFSIIRDISKQRALQNDLWHYQGRLEEMVDQQTDEIRRSSRLQVTVLSVGGVFLLALVLMLWNSLRRQNATQAELVDSETRYREIVEKTQDLISRVDREGQLQFVNHKAETIFGIPPEECIGRSAFDFVHPDDREKTRNAFQDWVANKESYVVFENRQISRDGKVHIVLWTIQIHYDEFGEAETLTSIGRDITTRVNAEQALEKAMLDAENANKAKSQFLASMSHELRTPLNAVLGFAQMLRMSPDAPLSKKQDEYVSSIETGGEHLLQLVGDILDLAKIEADEIHLFLEYVDPKAIAGECISLVRHLAAERSITVDDGFIGKVVPMVRADPIRLKQGLINLLTNAVRYNVDGGKVLVRQEETSDGFLRISVEDTGIGIDKKHSEEIFTIFHRLNVDPTRTVEGAGIGLAVTKQLIERMGGRINFESREGEGSTFWIDVPLSSNRETLVWADNLSVRVPAIDEDHKELIRLINDAGQPGLTAAGAIEICSDLVRYTLYHFRREEALMKVCNYPDMDNHIKQHRTLEAKVKAFQVRVEAGDESARGDLRAFLRDWLVTHIMNVDRLIYDYAVGKEKAIETALQEIS